MGAADDIRAGVLEKFEGLEDAGLNEVTVEAWTRESATGGADYAGKAASVVYQKITIKPNPRVTLKHSEAVVPEGFIDRSDVSIEGAFPTTLGGQYVTVSGETEAPGATITRGFATPDSFLALLQNADYFMIGGVKYVFRGRGAINLDHRRSQWRIFLLRADS